VDVVNNGFSCSEHFREEDVIPVEIFRGETSGSAVSFLDEAMVAVHGVDV
jgi:hypothetical protein